MVMADTRAEHFLLPVNVGTTVLQRDAIVLCILAQLAGSSHIVGLEDVVECSITIIGHVGSLFTTVFGGDDDHTISSLRTIDGCCSSITEHIDAFDIVGRNHRNVDAGNAVNNIVRLHSGTRTQRRSTTQRDGGSAVRVGCRRNNQSGNLTLQHLTGIGEDTLVQVFGLHGGNGRCDVLTLHGTITNDNNLIQELVVFLQRDAFACVDGLSFKAHIGHIQLGTRLYIE